MRRPFTLTHSYNTNIVFSLDMHTDACTHTHTSTRTYPQNTHHVPEAALAPVVAVPALGVRLQSLQQREELAGLQETGVDGDVGLAKRRKRVEETLVQLPARVFFPRCCERGCARVAAPASDQS